MQSGAPGKMEHYSSKPLGTNWLRGVLFVFLLIFSSTASAASAISQDDPQIIILNSYHKGFTWSDAEESGFLERLREIYPAIDVPIEHLDAKRHSNQENLERMKDFLIRKYSGRQPDLVAAFDNPALDMLIQYRAELFPNARIVFAGISDFEQSMLAGRKNVTGLAETKM